MFHGKKRASIYVLVLVLVVIATLLVTLLFSSLESGILQFTLEKETQRLEGLLLAGLDRITADYMDNPSVIINDSDGRIYLYEFGICGEANTYSKNTKCADESAVYIDKYYQIIGYLAKNSEGIQVTLSAPSAAPKTGSDSVIEIHSRPNGNDILLVTSYFVNGGQLDTSGSCLIHYDPTGGAVSYTECIGGVTATVIPVDPAKSNTYGLTRVRVQTTASEGVNFYRIVSILKDPAQTIYLSVTGSNYSDLPVLQQLVFGGVAYSIGDENKRIKVERVRVLMAQPSMPEVFDWVLFNGAPSPIVK